MRWPLLCLVVTLTVGCRSSEPTAPVKPEAPAQSAALAPGVIAIPFKAEGHAAHPRWSAKGQFLSYEVIGRADQRRLFVQSVGESGPNRPVIEVIVKKEGEALSVHAAEWHPEPLLIFEAGRSSDRPSLYRMAPNKKHLSAPLFKEALVPPPQAQPGVSAQGNQVAWIHEGDVYVWPRGKDAPRRVSATKEAEWGPVFSQNGRVLLYTRGGLGTRDLFQFDLLTGEETVVADGPGDQFAGVWGRGGQVAYYSSDAIGPPYSLVLVQTDRSERRVISANVQMTVDGRPGVSEERDWLGYSVKGSGALHFVHLKDGREVEVQTGLEQVGDVQIAQGFDDIYVAFTAMVPGKKPQWRDLYVLKVNDALGELSSAEDKAP